MTRGNSMAGLTTTKSIGIRSSPGLDESCRRILGRYCTAGPIYKFVIGRPSFDRIFADTDDISTHIYAQSGLIIAGKTL